MRYNKIADQAIKYNLTLEKASTWKTEYARINFNLKYKKTSASLCLCGWF